MVNSFMKANKNSFRIMIVLIIVLVGFSFGCQENINWIPKAEDFPEAEEKADLESPRVRVKHNIQNSGNIDIIIGKAIFADVKYGETTDYSITEHYNVPIIVTFKKFTNKILKTPDAVERVTILYLKSKEEDKKKSKFFKRTYYTVTLNQYDKTDQTLSFTINEDGKAEEMLKKLNETEKETEDSEVG